jgi:electron transfer flavoprotein alpha subunit
MLNLTKVNRLSSVFNRLKSTLVIVEHDNQSITPITLNAITAATKIAKNESITCLVVGTGCNKVAEDCSKISGVNKVRLKVFKNLNFDFCFIVKFLFIKQVLIADNEAFKGFMPEAIAPFVAQSQKKLAFTHIAMGSSAFGKNLIPRVAALLDTQPISDIIGMEDENTFIRTIYAGNAIQTVKAKDPIKIFTVRGTAYEAAKLNSASSNAEVTKADSDVGSSETSSFVGQELAKSDRPSLTAAKVVIR